jgi:O-antigen ligase
MQNVFTDGWQELEWLLRKPWTGFGANSFYNNYQPYTAAAFKTWVSNNPEHSTVHNYYSFDSIRARPASVDFYSSLGFADILVLLQAQQLYHQFQNNYYRAIALVLGIILLMIASLNFTSDLIETDKIGGLFWLAAGLLIGLKYHLKIEKETIAI